MKKKCKIASRMKKIIISIWVYLHNERVFCYKVFSVLINYQGLSFGGFSLKIELVVFTYKLIIYYWKNYLFYYYYYYHCHTQQHTQWHTHNTWQKHRATHTNIKTRQHKTDHKNNNNRKRWSIQINGSTIFKAQTSPFGAGTMHTQHWSSHNSKSQSGTNPPQHLSITSVPSRTQPACHPLQKTIGLGSC